MSAINQIKTEAHQQMFESLQQAAWAVLQCQNVAEKIALGKVVAQRWKHGELVLDVKHQAQPLPVPGRPDQPALLSPHKMPKRNMRSDKGRLALMHAVAHIEFNAINLAWDAIYRFANMPRAYYDDWLSVALDEARHFELLNGYLQKRGTAYGDFSAHNGLWEMAVKTDHDVLIRMALVPRVLEARGLDVTPDMLIKLNAAGDEEAVAHLTLILEEEVNHVRIGTRWYRYCCAQRGLESKMHFIELIKQYMKGAPKGAMNIEARLQAGFEHDELEYLKAIS